MIQQKVWNQDKRISAADIDRVIEVAGRLFSEKGYAGVGIREIAHDSGMTMPSIFYHFGSKSSLYEEVIDYRYRSHVNTISSKLKPLHDASERLECIVGSLFDIISADREFLLLLQRDVIELVASHNRPNFVQTYRWLSTLIVDLLETALNKPAEKRVADALLALVLGYCEITAAFAPNMVASSERRDWYSAQRTELLHHSKRMVLG